MTSDIHPITSAGIIAYGIPTVAFLIFAILYPTVLRRQGRSFFNSQDEVFYYVGSVAVTSIFWPTLLFLCLISGAMMLPSLVFKGLLGRQAHRTVSQGGANDPRLSLRLFD